MANNKYKSNLTSAISLFCYCWCIWCTEEEMAGSKRMPDLNQYMHDPKFV